ncbi:MAG TPA: ribulose-phosphate 3-epimerase [Patescibacteria group bacterium]|nr:ribulose-phosphate 3-epimerase [Patescibacteria group bacterium]
MLQIVPAILVGNITELKDQCEKVKRLDPSYIQLDVMDGIFVNNRSFTERVELNELHLPFKLELHLMVSHPLQEIDSWKDVVGLKRIVFHAESKDNLKKVIEKIKSSGLEAGMAINPETDLSEIVDFCDIIDLVLFMTVHPGQQGQQFIQKVGERIQSFKTLIENRGKITPQLAVDGGIKPENVSIVKSWGIDIAYVGSALVGATDIQEAYTNLTRN